MRHNELDRNHVLDSLLESVIYIDWNTQMSLHVAEEIIWYKANTKHYQFGDRSKNKYLNSVNHFWNLDESII